MLETSSQTQLGSEEGNNREGKPVTRSVQVHQAAIIDVSHEKILTIEQERILLNKEHYEKLKTLLNHLGTRVEFPTAKTASCSFVQIGSIEALSAFKDCLSSICIIDYGVTNHMTSHTIFFSNYIII